MSSLALHFVPQLGEVKKIFSILFCVKQGKNTTIQLINVIISNDLENK